MVTFDFHNHNSSFLHTSIEKKNSKRIVKEEASIYSFKE